MTTSTDSLRVVYLAANLQQAHLLAGALEQQGMATQVTNEALQGIVGALPAGFPTAPRLLVDEKDAARAREIALEFERKLRPSKTEACAARAWHQFSVQALLLLTAGVAVYLGVDRFLAASGRANTSSGAFAAVFLLASVAFVVAMYCKLRGQRGDDDV
ncbi:MAG: DUF2007 domain-containing protein [Pirellulales bacterium]